LSDNNKNIVIKALKDTGITNPVSIAAIMAVVQKESNFKPQSERSYATTSNARIRSIFSITRSLTEDQLKALKKDPVKFFNLVYGGKYGNGMNEGFLYRGRGFNQLTFKGNYKRYGDMLGIDLVKNPDLVNDPVIAAKIVGLYMKSTFKDNAAIVKSRYGAKDVNDFTDSNRAVNAFYNANAGFGKDTSRAVISDKTKALKSVDSLYKTVLTFLGGGGGSALGFIALLGIIYFTNK
jgi:predicted chitinase